MNLQEAMNIARNPWGHDTGTVREARLAVCDEVERLERENQRLAERQLPSEEDIATVCRWVELEWQNVHVPTNVIQAVGRICPALRK